MIRILQLLFVVLITNSLWAQETFKIYGGITDRDNNPLIGASVYDMETFIGSASNFNGDYELPGLSVGNHKIIVSLIGFKSDTFNVEINNKNVNISRVLENHTALLHSFEISAERITERTSTSNISLDKQTLKTSQGLTEDPIRTLSTMPGVGRTGDLFSPSEIYVRGGAPDENLFLMDNNKIYFPYYFGGQKSLFNTDAVESIEFLTGGFSAAYGNHMSSVMNVQTRDGNYSNYAGNISLGFYNSSILFEGPIIKEKVSVLLAFRRTYLDLFLGDDTEFPVTSFGDVTYKLSYKLNKKHKLSFSGLSSTEAIDFIAANTTPGLPDKLETSGKNHFQSLQLKSSTNSKIYNKLSATNSLNKNVSEIGANMSFNIDAWQLGIRDDLTYYISNRHKLKAGVEWQYGSFDYYGNLPLDPLQTDFNDTTVILRNIDINKTGEVIRSAYLLYDGNPIKKVGINTGLRFDQNPNNKYVDISPRIAINYQLTSKSKVRFSTGMYRQFPNSQNGVDLISSTAIHYILGYEYRFSDNFYGWVEGYIKEYSDLVYYDLDLNYSNKGEGIAKGVEFFLRKEKGNMRGWISYALSHSERLAPLYEEVKDFEFDQRHVFNVVAEYHFPKKPKQMYIPALFQVNFRYADGTPFTPVKEAVNYGSGWIPIQGEQMSVRNNDYLNLNVRLEWKIPVSKVVRISSFMEVWNLTNQKNVLGRAYQYGTDYDNNVNEQEYYSTPLLVGGGFKFEFGKY